MDMDVDVWRHDHLGDENQFLNHRGLPRKSRARSIMVDDQPRHRSQQIFLDPHFLNTQTRQNVSQDVETLPIFNGAAEEEGYGPNVSLRYPSQKRDRTPSSYSQFSRKRHQSEYPASLRTSQMQDLRNGFLDDNQEIFGGPRWHGPNNDIGPTEYDQHVGDVESPYQAEEQDDFEDSGYRSAHGRSMGSTPQNRWIRPFEDVVQDHPKSSISVNFQGSPLQHSEAPLRGRSQLTPSQLTPRQLANRRRAQSVAPQLYHDRTQFQADSIVRTQDPKSKPQLGEPLWPTASPPSQLVLPYNGSPQVQGRIVIQRGHPSTPENEMTRSRSLAPASSRSASRRPPQDFGSSSGDDTPLEKQIRRRGVSKVRFETNTRDYNAREVLPAHGLFSIKSNKTSQPQTPQQSFQTSAMQYDAKKILPAQSNTPIKIDPFQKPQGSTVPATPNQILCIDLVTPDTTPKSRLSKQYLPAKSWTPRAIPPQSSTSTPLRNATKRAQPDNNQANASAEFMRQEKAAKLIVEAESRIAKQESRKNNEDLDMDLFDETLSEAEKEKQEREEAIRLEAERQREIKEKKIALEEEKKRRREEERAAKLREKEAADQLAREQKEAERAERLRQDRERQAKLDLDNAKERRRQADDRKREADEKARIKEQTERESREANEKLARLQRDIQKQNKSIAQLVANQLISAKKVATDSNSTEKPPDSSAPTQPPQTNTDLMDGDDDDLFVPDTQGPAGISTSVSSKPANLDNVTSPHNTEASSSMIVCPTDTTVSRDVGDTMQSNVAQSEDLFMEDVSVAPQNVQGPANAAEIFAHSTASLPKDREAEREAERQARLQQRRNERRERPKSTSSESSPAEPVQKEVPNEQLKEVQKPKPKKKSAQPSKPAHDSHSLFGNMFSTKLKPLHGSDESVHAPNQPVRERTEASASQLQLPAHPLLPPQPNSAPIPKPGNILISHAEAFIIDAQRKRVEREAQAKRDADKEKRSEASRNAIIEKNTIKKRKEKEIEFRENARKDGKEITDVELKALVDKFMEKRDRENERKRVNERRRKMYKSKATDSGGHDFGPGIGPVPSTANRSGAENGSHSSSSSSSTSSSSLFGTDLNQENQGENESEKAEIQARKEREAQSEASLNALRNAQQSRGARFSQSAAIKEVRPIVSDSDESEEDPDDDETVEDMLKQQAKNRVVEKAAANPIEVQNGQEQEDEDSSSDDDASSTNSSPTNNLNPDDYDTQIVTPMPDMSSSFETTQISAQIQEAHATEATTTNLSFTSAPQSTRRPKSTNYKLVNVYYVMTQKIYNDLEEEPEHDTKKFYCSEKAKKHAQTVVNGFRNRKQNISIVEKWDAKKGYTAEITHDEERSTLVFVKTVTMAPKDISKYDPTEVKPKFELGYYMIKYKKVKEVHDVEANIIRETTTSAYLDSSKLYTVLEMANHDAGEFLLNEIKPKDGSEEHRREFENNIKPYVRLERDNVDQEAGMLSCEVTPEAVAWLDCKSFEVEVEQFKTEGPVN